MPEQLIPLDKKHHARKEQEQLAKLASLPDEAVDITDIPEAPAENWNKTCRKVGKMVWNYRVIVRDNATDPGKKVYGVHEVYYDEDGSIRHWTADPVEAIADSPDEMTDTLFAMLAATERHVLVEAGHTLVEAI